MVESRAARRRPDLRDHAFGTALMFFVLSKLLGFFAIPSNLIVLIGIVGLFFIPTRFARAGRWLAFVSLVVLAILGLSPIGNALIIPLEHRFPPWDATRGPPDGIVVLGGAIDGLGPGNEVGLNEGAERLTVVPELARRYPNARILFSGGSAALIDGDAEAKFALPLLESLGVARDRITLEDHSRNTGRYEHSLHGERNSCTLLPRNRQRSVRSGAIDADWCARRPCAGQPSLLMASSIGLRSSEYGGR